MIRAVPKFIRKTAPSLYKIELVALLSAFNLCWLWYHSSKQHINIEWINFLKPHCPLYTEIVVKMEDIALSQEKLAETLEDQDGNKGRCWVTVRISSPLSELRALFPDSAVNKTDRAYLVENIAYCRHQHIHCGYGRKAWDTMNARGASRRTWDLRGGFEDLSSNLYKHHCGASQ